MMGKIKTSEAFKYSKLMLKKFYPKDNLTFDQITFAFIDKFRNYLTSTHSVNGISVVLRTLRSLYNKALNYGKFKEKEYPWKKVLIKSQPTAKRAISKEEMQCIATLDLEYGSRLWHSRNYFLFSYLTQGMNFKDLSELQWRKDIIDAKIAYRRSKTGDLFAIAINDKIRNIIDHYENIFHSPHGYIFPIMKAELSPVQKANRVRKCLKQTNQDLKQLAILAKVANPDVISFYVARHSFATTLKRLGYSTSIISDALGHSDEKTTQIYLAGFDNSVFDEANDRLL
jgi:integrase/recombinase XerD